MCCCVARLVDPDIMKEHCFVCVFKTLGTADLATVHHTTEVLSPEPYCEW